MWACSQNRLATGSVFFALAMALAGCAAPPPKDFKGDWRPVNQFQSATSEIPLTPVYTFYASPMDSTLRTMLKRWAADKGLQLDYQLASDYTLSQPVANIRATDIAAAARELSTIYAPQKIAVTIDSKRILVHRSDLAP